MKLKTLEFLIKQHADGDEEYMWLEAPILIDMEIWPDFELKYVIETIPETDMYTLFMSCHLGDEHSEVIGVDEDVETLKTMAQEHFESLFQENG